MASDPGRALSARRPLVVVLVAALAPVVLLLALAPFHTATRFSGSGYADGYCPAPLVSAVRRSGDGAGLWTATAPGERLYYLPRASKPPVVPPGGAQLSVPQAPCHSPSRVRLVAAAAVLVLISLVPSLAQGRGGAVRQDNRRPRSAMMTA